VSFAMSTSPATSAAAANALTDVPRGSSPPSAPRAPTPRVPIPAIVEPQRASGQPRPPTPSGPFPALSDPCAHRRASDRRRRPRPGDARAPPAALAIAAPPG
jgi:hypothetical protein